MSNNKAEELENEEGREPLKSLEEPRERRAPEPPLDLVEFEKKGKEEAYQSLLNESSPPYFPEFSKLLSEGHAKNLLISIRYRLLIQELAIRRVEEEIKKLQEEAQAAVTKYESTGLSVTLSNISFRETDSIKKKTILRSQKSEIDSLRERIRISKEAGGKIKINLNFTSESKSKREKLLALKKAEVEKLKTQVDELSKNLGEWERRELARIEALRVSFLQTSTSERTEKHHVLAKKFQVLQEKLDLTRDKIETTKKSQEEALRKAKEYGLKFGGLVDRVNDEWCRRRSLKFIKNVRENPCLDALIEFYKNLERYRQLSEEFNKLVYVRDPDLPFKYAEDPKYPKLFSYAWAIGQNGVLRAPRSGEPRYGARFFDVRSINEELFGQPRRDTRFLLREFRIDAIAIEEDIRRNLEIELERIRDELILEIPQLKAPLTQFPDRQQPQLLPGAPQSLPVANFS